MRKTTSFMLSFGLAAGLALPVAAVASTPDAGVPVAQGQSQKPKPDKPAKPAKPAKAEDKQNKPNKPAAQQPAAQQRDNDRDRRVIDRDGHVRVIRDYAREGLPPGLAKREQLPPGLRQQIQENGALPPGLQKRLVPVPAEWSNLPPIGQYERRYFAGDDLIIVDTRTGRIVAYLRDVLR